MMESLRQYLIDARLQESPSEDQSVAFFDGLFDRLRAGPESERGRIVALFEEFYETSVWLLAHYLADRLFRERRLRPSDSTQTSATCNDLFVGQVEAFVKTNPQIRLSEYAFDASNLDTERECLLNSAVDCIQGYIQNAKLDEQDIGFISAQLSVAKSLARDLNRPSTFYYLCQTFLQRLNAEKKYQPARDFAEELFISSQKDDLEWVGALTQFYVYAEQHNFVFALFYADYFLNLVKDSACEVTAFSRFCTTGIKLFRNMRFLDLSEKIFDFFVQQPDISDREKDSAHIAHINALLMRRDRSAVAAALLFVAQRREAIITDGEQAAFTVCHMLSAVQKIFPSERANEIIMYENLFRGVLGAGAKERLKTLIDGGIDDILREVLSYYRGVRQSRSGLDAVAALRIVEPLVFRLVHLSAKGNRIPEFTFAAHIQADISLEYDTQSVDGDVLEYGVAQRAVETAGDLEDALKNFVSHRPDFIIVLMADGYSNTYFTLYCDGTPQSENIHMLCSATEYHRISEELRSTLIYEDTVQVGSQRVSTEFSDHERAYEKCRSITKDIVINIPTETRNVVFLRPQTLIDFPSNLFPISKGTYLYENHNVVDAFNIRQLQTWGEREVSRPISISALIPVDRGDIPLNLLFARLESTLLDHNVRIIRDIGHDVVDGDVNIVAMHGDETPERLLLMFPDRSTAVTNPRGLVGLGSLLILLVCHSGKTVHGVLDNKVHSLVRAALEAGYPAVIAPKWALHVDVAQLWLPVFLDTFAKGATSLESCGNANRSIHSGQPNPAGAAAMHYFGNPWIRASRPVH